MKTKIIIILFCIVSANMDTYAQTIFPLSGAKWTYANYAAQPGNYTYHCYVLHGDTVIDNIQRAKLYYIPNIKNTDTILIGFFHIQGSTVFFKPYYYHFCICEDMSCLLSDYPLYDFSLSIGNNIDFLCSEICYISSVDTIVLGGISRKRITFSNCLDEQWIEGMGSINGLFYRITPIPTGYSPILVCFTQDDELIYMNPYFSECPHLGYGNAIQETKTDLFAIFPNPATSMITVQSYQPLKWVQIYDMTGTLLYEQMCNSKLQTVIQNLPQPPGTYIAKISLQNGDVRTEKIIIQ